MTITATPKSVRPHIAIAEMVADMGYRYRSAPMPEFALDQWVRNESRFGAVLSDYCCTVKCWCFEESVEA